MNKIKEFTDGERNQYSKLYVDFIMHGQELEALQGLEESEKRFFVKKAPIIKGYLDQLDDADYKADGSGLFEIFKSDDKYKDEVIRYKKDINQDLEKLKKCHRCQCLTCLKACPVNSCHTCQYNHHVGGCDKERYFIAVGHKPITLYSNDEQRDVYFNVVGILTDAFSNKRYIYLVEATNPDNQHILEYCKYINGKVDYLPLDEEILNHVYDAFVKGGCYA